MGDEAAGAATKPERRNGLVTSVRAAFSSWWALLGILAASVSGFNLARNAFQIELWAVVAEMARGYQALVHSPIFWLFQSLHWPRPPSLAIDAVALWLLAGGVVLRAASTMRRSGLTTPRLLSGRRFLRLLLTRQNSLPLFVLFCLVLWPLAVVFLVQEPIVHRADDFPRDGRPAIGPTLYVHKTRRDRERFAGGTVTYLYDLRIVLATQAVVSLLCLIGWFALNALLKLYA